MEKFSPLSNESVNDRELKLIDYWNEIDLLHETLRQREDGPRFNFYEGPPTANGKPGIHHVVSRTLKDLTCRHKVMKGYYVERKAGWDTHGLPVEIEVEKKLGLHNKKDIEAYGIEEFNKECKESVFQYESLWRKMTERMAYEIDLDNPYVTFHNDYIESVWHIIDKMFKDDLLYEGHKILPYCPRCGTGLASHEVAQGYENITTTTAYVKFKRKDSDEYFIAWTTTPWTLPSNVSLTVNKDVKYDLVKNLDNGELYWMASELKEAVLKGVTENYEVVKSVMGSELEGICYEQLIPMVKPDKKAFYITVADYVTTTDGTGIVHTAPAFGEDDYNTGRRYDLPVINPVNEEGKFALGFWEGMSVFDSDPKVLDYLKEEGKLLRKQKVEHNYPHCWRCHTPLIYYAKPSWYINVTSFKDKLIAANNDVKWYPDFIGEKRFGNWLENLNDWALSRTRYWGTPLPIWRCDSCGETTSIGSIKELVDRSIEDIDENIDLHRPYVDNCHLKCEKCGGTMTRYKDVIDVWFDSGSMPFAQRHYPFEHADDFDKYFPADFICEGIDQTRGWFYSLIAIATYMTGRSSFKSVLVNDLVLDKYGKKMSKHKGNTLDPFEIFEKYGADVARFYAIYVSVPWLPTKYDEDGLREVESKFIRSLRNIYTFFQLYVNSEDMKPDELDVPIEERDELDRWILSRYNSLVKSVEENIEIFELTKISKAIVDFVVEDFSNWYIRRSRRRFWGEASRDKDAAFRTSYEVLLSLTKLIAPFTPFIADELYLKLADGKSVHLENYPEADLSLIDLELEAKIELVRKIVSLGRAAREKENIKVRQPIESIVIDKKYQTKIDDLEDLIKEELNIKKIDYVDDVSEYMNYELKPNFKIAGPVLGKKVGEFSKYLSSLDRAAFIKELEDGAVEIELSGDKYSITPDYVDIRVSAKEGYDVQLENGLYVLLNTQLTPELIEEGYSREFTSKIQQERKRLDFDISDRIEIYYSADEEFEKAIDLHAEEIKDETLALVLQKKDLVGEKIDMNGHDVIVEIRRI
ncbi:MAG: isoleucine--tRNA ligase [Ezakiella sp.]|nr:isoleucine--tRNA ligase [Ezakiella sp.]MDY3946657.1 isoleucine--tRNA ligase [Ezakiella sp.]